MTLSLNSIKTIFNHANVHSLNVEVKQRKRSSAKDGRDKK